MATTVHDKRVETVKCESSSATVGKGHAAPRHAQRKADTVAIGLINRTLDKTAWA